MDIEVTRTSQWDDGQPCDGLTLKRVPRHDRRGYATPEEHDKKHGHCGKWLDTGADHTTWSDEHGNGGIQRTVGTREAWFLSAETLEDLAAFVGAHGELVVGLGHDGSLKVEIYDDYRE